MYNIENEYKNLTTIHITQQRMKVNVGWQRYGYGYIRIPFTDPWCWVGDRKPCEAWNPQLEAPYEADAVILAVSAKKSTFRYD